MFDRLEIRNLVADISDRGDIREMPFLVKVQYFSPEELATLLEELPDSR